MPYKVVKRDDQFCVYRHDEDGNAVGESHGCHETREQANRQMAALYVAESEKKEIEEADDTTGEALSLLDRLRALFTKERPMKSEGDGKHPSSHYLVVEDPSQPSTWHLRVRDASGKVDHTLLGGAWAALHKGYRGNKYEGPGKTEALAKLKRLYAAEGMPLPGESKENSFFVWKEATGYRWLAAYSSKFRDDDKPPEILSEASHKEFVAAVDNGEWPMPELWLWHVKGTVSGRADFLAYDDAGFALASGTFDPGYEPVAEALAAQDDLLTSHGMPGKEIRRDGDDPTVITRYRTHEVSPLPAWAAANRTTGFAILKEVDDMALPETKRQWLTGLLGEERVKAIEMELDAKGKSLEDAGTEFKEAAPEVEAAVVEPEAAPEVKEPEATVTEQAEAATEPAPAPDYPTRAEVAQAVGESLTPILERLDGLTAVVEALGKEVKAQKQTDDERLKEAVRQTPAASLFAQIQSAIGSKEAEIDGRSSLAKAGPAAPPASEAEGMTKVPLINAFLDAAWKQQ